MLSPDDLMLRNAFRELRREETSCAPMWGRATARPPIRHFQALAAAFLVVVVMTTFAVLLRPAPTIDASLTNWTAPTDFLLQTPQADLLHNVPPFGERNLNQ